MVLATMAQTWSKTIIYKMSGYGVKGNTGEFYIIGDGIENWDGLDYGLLVGPYYSFPLVICLLFTGAISDHFNRKIIVTISCIG